MENFMPIRILAEAALVAAACLAAPTVSALAGEWAGTVETRNGVPHVMNPADPAHPPATLELEELWRLGGNTDSDEEFFGVVNDVVVDDAGDVYILDSQLSEIKVYDSDGAYLRTIGREGEGPGEFRRPRAIFETAGGEIAVLQLMPGRIVLLTKQGDPAGEFELPELEGGGRRMLQAGDAAGDLAVVLAMDMRMGSGEATSNTVLAGYGPGGEEVVRYFAKEHTTKFANPTFDEREAGVIPWAAGSRGHVATAPVFGEYEIHVWGPDRSLSHVIHREFEHLRRTDREIERAKARFVIRGPTEIKKIVSDHHPDVGEMFLRPDGGLWVRTSRGTSDPEAGTLGTFDVFDPEGRFVRQVSLVGEGDTGEDGYLVIGDRMYVLRHLNSASRAMFGDGEEGAVEEDEELEPMEVVCYRLPAAGI
jgi:hypothetical protein